MLHTLALLALPLASAQLHPEGSAIGSAAGVIITPAGLNSVDALAESVLPSDLPLDDITETACYDSWTCWAGCVGEYTFSLSGAWVKVTVNDIAITPGNNQLDVYADLRIQLNDAFDEMYLYAEASCIEFVDCPGYIKPFNAQVTMPLGLTVQGGRLDATVGQIAFAYDLQSDDIVLSDCALADIEGFLDLIGLSLYDLILDQAATLLEDQVAALGPELETTIEDLFASATISETVEVLDASLQIDLAPGLVAVTPAGIEVWMDGAVSGSPAPCVAGKDPGGSLLTASEVVTPASVPGSVHAALILGDDFLNQALYAAWRSGVLCYSLSGADSPDLPINTSILGLLAGDAFDELFPETSDLIIATRPAVPPTGSFKGASPIELVVPDLGLDLYAGVDDRMSRILGLDADIKAGIGLGFDSSTGELGIELDLPTDQFVVGVLHSELSQTPAADIELSVASSLGSLIDTLVGPLLGDSLAFAIPSIEGLGLTDLYAQPLGSAQESVGLMAMVGAVTYESGGCGGCGGGTSSTTSCDMGCASAVGQSRWATVFALLLGAVAARRRR